MRTAISQPKLPPKFSPENRLEELVLTYGKGPETDAEFYRELLSSDIITLGNPAPGSKIKDGFQRLEANTRFNVRLLQYEGEPVVAIYSSMERLTAVIPEEYFRETGYLKLNCRTLLGIMMSSDPKSKFALNPGHMVVKTFSPDEVQALLDGTIFKQLEDARIAMTAPRPLFYPKGTQFSVGRPKVVPTGLMDKLADYFQSTGDVEQAFLGEVFVPSSGQPPHLMLCLKLREKSRRMFDEVARNLGPTIRSVLGEHELLDILDVKAEPRMPLSNLIRIFPK